MSLLVCLAAVTVAGWQLFTPYSYWLNELFSVNLSRLPIREMHAVLLNDVHPPLYQVLLKLWMKMAGPYGHLDPPQYARLLAQMRALGARRIHPAHEPVDGFEPGVYLVN